MENPNTWTDVTRVIQDALAEVERQNQEGIIGHSAARVIENALRDKAFLREHGPGEPLTDQSIKATKIVPVRTVKSRTHLLQR